MNASEVLWTDDSLYRRRYEKSASALVAVAKALERNRPLGGGETEFLELYERVSAADAGGFTRVWSDPTAYYWVRLAYEFVGNCLTPAPVSQLALACSKAHGALDAKAALAAHLGDFKRFVLALGLVSNIDQHFDEPMEVPLPFAIPASRLVLSGEGRLAIHALVDGDLDLTCGEERILLRLKGLPLGVASLNARQCPVAMAGDYGLLLQPEAYHLPGLDVGEPLLLLTPMFQSQHLDLTEQALALIHRFAPAAFEQFRDVIRLIGLKPSNLGNYTNITHSDLPGSFVCSVVSEPYLMADAFIHELHHNRLFFIEELGAFFAREEDNLMTRNEYYSPWREDLRPLHGIFHGLYVFLAVWRFWLAVYTSGETSGLRLSAVKDQIARIALELTIAVCQLRRYADFTSFGTALFEAMAAEVSSIQAVTRDLGFPYDLPAMSCNQEGGFSPLCGSNGRELTVREAIQSHAEKYDINRQCAEVDSIVGASLRSIR